MGLGVVKALLLLQLSLLFISSFSEEIDSLPATAPAHPPQHHHHHHPPAEAPHHHPPAEAPHHHHHHGHPPAHAPTHGPHPPKPAPVPVHPPKPTPPVQPPKPSPPKPSPPVHPPKPSPPKPSPPVHPPKPSPPKTSPPVHPPKPSPHKPKPPVYPPKSSPPVHPPKPAPGPAHPPVHPPHHPFPRAFVAVQGVVYCKSCKYHGIDTLLGASPLLGASVKLECNNTKYTLVSEGKTDKNGYFYMKGPKTITNYGAHKCVVKLGASPLATCSQPSLLHGGVSGAALKPEKFVIVNKLPFVIYTVGPLAYEPKCH